MNPGKSQTVRDEHRNKNKGGTRGVYCYKRNINEPWNNGGQEKCAALHEADRYSRGLHKGKKRQKYG